MLPNAMRAVQIVKTGGFEVLEMGMSIVMPKCGKGQVLVKNSYAGVNYIDTYQRSGLYPIELPAVLGREGAGEIVALGEGVPTTGKDGLAIGNRVAYLGSGTYAEYTAVSATHVLRLPDAIALEQGAAMLLQGMTAAYLVHESYPIGAGEWALVPAAAGGTGGLLCQMIKAASGMVIGLVSNETKAARALSHGADYVINYKERPDWHTEVMNLTGGRGVNVAYDGVGGSIYKQVLSCMAKKGTYINFGNAGGVVDIAPFDLTPKCLKLMRPTLFGYIGTRDEFLVLADRVLGPLLDGKLKIEIHKVYPLEEVAKAHSDLEGRLTSGKLLLKIA